MTDRGDRKGGTEFRLPGCDRADELFVALICGTVFVAAGIVLGVWFLWLR